MNSQIQNQDLMLKESIEHFLKLYQNGSSDFSSFESIFFRLIQTMLDPPLEITWFYSAVTFHASKSNSQKNNPSTRVLIAKDLLNLLLSCSNLSSASKKIVLLAPVVYELYNILYDFRKKGLNVESEVEKLLDNIIGYVMMFAGVYDNGNGVVEFDNMAVCFEDLVRVWTADRGGGSLNTGENLKMFFPVLSDGIWRGMSSKRRVQELVGIVMCEVFLLRLSLSFGSGASADELLTDTKYLAIQTIKAIHNCYFLDMLLKTLLEPSLPVTALLCSEDTLLLQKVLYDAVVLVDYSFYFGRWSQSADSHSKKLALLWLLVANRAIQFARSTNDQATAVTYLNAFGESQIVTEIIKWAGIQAGIKEPNCRPNNLTPPVLIEWLLILEDQGIRIFDGASLLRAKAVVSKSRMESGWPHLMLDRKNDDGYVFVCDEVVKKDQELGNPSNNTFCSMNPGIDSGKKRKEAFRDPRESKVKHAKHDSLGSNTKGKLLPFSGGNKVIIVVSDDDDDMDEV